MAKQPRISLGPKPNRRNSSASILERKNVDTIVCVFVLVVILVASVVFSYLTYRNATNEQEDAFNDEFDNTARILIENYLASMQQVANTGGLVAVAFQNGLLSGAEFTHLVAPSVEAGSIRGVIRGITYSPYITDNASRADFENLLLHTDYGPGLPSHLSAPANIDKGIWHRDASGAIVTAEWSPVYTPVYVAYPLDTNQEVIGFDIYITDSRKIAIDTVLATGRDATTDIIQLVADVGDGRGSCLVVSPVYNASGESADNLKGFVVSAINLDGLLQEVLPDFVAGIDVVLSTSRGAVFTFNLRGTKVRRHHASAFSHYEYIQLASYLFRYILVIFPTIALLNLNRCFTKNLGSIFGTKVRDAFIGYVNLHFYQTQISTYTRTSIFLNH